MVMGRLCQHSRADPSRGGAGIPDHAEQALLQNVPDGFKDTPFVGFKQSAERICNLNAALGTSRKP